MIHRTPLPGDGVSKSRLHKWFAPALVAAACLVFGVGVWIAFDTAQRRAARMIWDYGGMPSYYSEPPPNWAIRLNLDSYFDGSLRLTGAIFSGSSLADGDLERLATALVPLEDFSGLEIYGTKVSLKGLAELREALPHVKITHDSDDELPARWLIASIRGFLRRGGVGPDYLRAVEAVREIEDKSDAIRGLTHLLPEEEAGDIACSVLGQIGPEAVPVLIGQLHHERADRRVIAASSLGNLGPDAHEAVSALTEATEDDEGSVRLAAAYALWQIDRSQQVALDVLRKCLTDDDEEIRLVGANLLGLIGQPATSAVPALTELLRDRSPEVRRAAEDALAEIDPATPRQQE